MPRRRLSEPPESTLYAPVKALLEGQGYEVKGEIAGCDVVGVRGDEPPVIIELKRRFGLGLVLQGIDRLALTDAVYVAVGSWPRNLVGARRLCRRVGVGLIVVADGRAEVLLDPVPYRPRPNRPRAARLLAEHRRRIGDPSTGRDHAAADHDRLSPGGDPLRSDSPRRTQEPAGAARDRPGPARSRDPSARRVWLVRACRAGRLPPLAAWRAGPRGAQETEPAEQVAPGD